MAASSASRIRGCASVLGWLSRYALSGNSAGGTRRRRNVSLSMHRNRAPVFVDQHGLRSRIVEWLFRGITVIVIGLLAMVGLSLIFGVSLPGVGPPARVPPHERPVRRGGPAAIAHAGPRKISKVNAPAESPGPVVRSLPTSPPLSSVASTPGLAATSRSPMPSGSLTPSGSPTLTPTPVPSGATAPASTHANHATATPTATSHGQPPVTPPGRTKQP